MEELTAALITLVSKYPLAMTVVSIVGTFRLINKPLFSILRTIVGQTETKSDDLMLDKVEASKAYKALCYFADWFGSLKLPKAK